MHPDKKQVALHEAGHTLGHILTGLPFSHVTIDPYYLAINSDGKSLGYVQPALTYYTEKPTSYSRLLPDTFCNCFKQDVTIIGGYVAQRVFSKDFDRKGSKIDIKNLKYSPLMTQPEPFGTIYKKFLIAYTFQLFNMNVHKQIIEKIATELLKYGTLNSDQVKTIVYEITGDE